MTDCRSRRGSIINSAGTSPELYLAYHVLRRPGSGPACASARAWDVHGTRPAVQSGSRALALPQVTLAIVTMSPLRWCCLSESIRRRTEAVFNSPSVKPLLSEQEGPEP